MPAKKTTTLNLRINPAVKDGLREAAEKDHRSISNMIEVLILRHCKEAGITVPEQQTLFGDEDDGH